VKNRLAALDKMKSPNPIVASNGRAPSVSTHIRGAEAERERLRSALHDGIGQLLTSISFLASSLRQKLAEQELTEETETAAEILALTSQAIGETQALLQEKPLPNCTPGIANSSVALNSLA